MEGGYCSRSAPEARFFVFTKCRIPCRILYFFSFFLPPTDRSINQQHLLSLLYSTSCLRGTRRTRAGLTLSVVISRPCFILPPSPHLRRGVTRYPRGEESFLRIRGRAPTPSRLFFVLWGGFCFLDLRGFSFSLSLRGVTMRLFSGRLTGRTGPDWDFFFGGESEGVVYYTAYTFV